MERHGVKFIGVSDAICEMAAEYGLNRSGIRKILIGTDTKAIQVGSIPITDRPKRILFAGRFVEKKGVEFLIRAFRDVRCSVPNAEIRLIGEGAKEAALRKLASDPDIHFVGRLSAEEVLREMHNARVLCVPSIRAADGDAEGLPTVITEAQASGLPVVTSAQGGKTEGILDGVSGIGFPERDLDALAKALVRVLRDDAFASAASTAARAFAERSLDIRLHTRRLEEFYDEVSARIPFRNSLLPRRRAMRRKRT